MPNPYCCDCQMFTVCVENGVTVPYPINRTVTGDKYACPKCKREILTDFGTPEFKSR